ncbi:hypothetical protein [Streptomyces sp. NPDC057426]|uniref:hypothetical protein n=1 Tax=Streptomyces sp. NPDC057426 TaxID=3346128 RepID=UPI0036AA5271
MHTTAPASWAPRLPPTHHTWENHGAQWLASTMDPPSIILAEWSDSPDHLAEVPLGVLFDVLRVADAIGLPALEELYQQRVALGPVLHCQPRQTVELLVPVGAAEKWDALRGTVCAGQGGTLRCPAPGTVSRGRTWLQPPSGTGVLTDPEVLRAALMPRARRSHHL